MSTSDIATFCQVTGAFEEDARRYILRSGGDINAAVNLYFETGGQLPQEAGPQFGFGRSSWSRSDTQRSTSNANSEELQTPQASQTPQNPFATASNETVQKLRASIESAQQRRQKAKDKPAEPPKSMVDPDLLLVPPLQPRDSIKAINQKTVVGRRPYA